MAEDKVLFIQRELCSLLATLQPEKVGIWGKMNAQQMIEHTADFFDVSAGKGDQHCVTPEEQLPKFKAFIFSDKQFRENTKAPENVVPEEPLALRTASMQAAIDKLEKSIDAFFRYFETDKSQTTVHPVFGPLNFDEWILLHYKHVTHHLRQFGCTTIS